MIARTKMREYTFLQLFQAAFHSQAEYEKQSELFRADMAPIDEEDKEELAARGKEILAHLDELDREIEANSEGWTCRRMGRVELTLLRLALYEMKYDAQVPVKVAINEAVELAKRYGGEDSPAFVNAVLGKLAAAEEA